MRTNLLQMMELVGARKDPGSMWREIARSKFFLPNLKALKGFGTETAIQLGKLLLRAIWLYFKQLLESIKELVLAAKKFIQALEDLVQTLQKELQMLAHAVASLEQTLRAAAKDTRRQVGKMKQRLRSKDFQETAVRKLRSLAEQGLRRALGPTQSTGGCRGVEAEGAGVSDGCV